MPLDNALKARHILAATNRTFVGRLKPIVLVTQSAGVYTCRLIQAVFRLQRVVDQQIPDIQGMPPHMVGDALLITPLSTDFMGALYVADTADPTVTAVADAQKYAIIAILVAGMLPGGTRYYVTLRRFQ